MKYVEIDKVEAFKKLASGELTTREILCRTSPEELFSLQHQHERLEMMIACELFVLEEE